jgi:hypothetical protein
MKEKKLKPKSILQQALLGNGKKKLQALTANFLGLQLFRF